MTTEITVDQFKAEYQRFAEDIQQMRNIYQMIEGLNTLREHAPTNEASDFETEFDEIFRVAVLAVFNRLYVMRKEYVSVVVTKAGNWYDYNGNTHSKEENVDRYASRIRDDGRIIRL